MTEVNEGKGDRYFQNNKLFYGLTAIIPLNERRL